MSVVALKHAHNPERSSRPWGGFIFLVLEHFALQFTDLAIITTQLGIFVLFCLVQDACELLCVVLERAQSNVKM